jgi:hypothetical protein
MKLEDAGEIGLPSGGSQTGSGSRSRSASRQVLTSAAPPELPCDSPPASQGGPALPDLDLEKNGPTKIHYAASGTLTERGSLVARRAAEWAKHKFAAVPAASVKQVW